MVRALTYTTGDRLRLKNLITTTPWSFQRLLDCKQSGFGQLLIIRLRQDAKLTMQQRSKPRDDVRARPMNPPLKRNQNLHPSDRWYAGDLDSRQLEGPTSKQI